jgi:S1-C subfamily serine protease
MLRVVAGWVVVLVLAVEALAGAPPARRDLLAADFDAAALDATERRLLQTALTLAGDYEGPLDGVWGADSDAALAAYAGRGFGPALNLHAGALVLDLLAEVERSGWSFTLLPDLGLSLALPEDRLGASQAESGGDRRWTEDGGLTLLTQTLDHAGALAWHDAAAAADARGAAGLAIRGPDRMVTAGVLGDGRRFHTRSERIGGRWSTVHVAATTEETAALALIAASVRPGPPLPWELPTDGGLVRLVSETRSFLDADALALPPPDAAALPGSGPDAGSGTGTAFYVGPRTLVTADHVVAACGAVSLADGTPLELVAADPELDIAALETAVPATRWLTLAAGARARLGQRVHAAGFPYYAIAGTSLHLTGGNVSALAGVDDDRRFFSFTAPVQPGNSGGPLIDAGGSVLGLVVARLSEDFIEQETGSLPQNVNYALGETEVAGFLGRHGLAPAEGGLGGFELDEGAPDGFEAAVVPIVCY